MKNNSAYEDLTIILPTLNEEGNIRFLIEELINILPDVSIIVVDDSSTDDTQKIVKKLAQNISQISLIERKEKPCLTLSIMEGMHTAKTDYIAWMDADFFHPPKIIKKLYKIAQLSGCCIASRFTKNKTGNKSANRKFALGQNDTLLLSILSSFLNFFTYHALKLNITDLTSGCIVCRKNLIENHNLVGDYGEYFIELMYYLNSSGIGVKEVFYESRPRKSGKSKTAPNIFKLFSRGIKYLWMVMRLMLPKKVFRRLSLRT